MTILLHRAGGPAPLDRLVFAWRWALLAVTGYAAVEVAAFVGYATVGALGADPPFVISVPVFEIIWLFWFGNRLSDAARNWP